MRFITHLNGTLNFYNINFAAWKKKIINEFLSNFEVTVWTAFQYIFD